MLHVGFSSGETVRFDLEDPIDAARWAACQRERQGEIRSVCVRCHGVSHNVPIPRDDFPAAVVTAELVRRGDGNVAGELVTVYFGGLAAEVMVHWGNRPRAVRYKVARVGRPVFLPGVHAEEGPCAASR